MQRPDTLRAVLDSVFRAPAYRWRTEKDPLALLHRWWAELKEWFRALQESNPIGYRVVMYLLVGVLVVILLHALWVLYRTIGAPPATDQQLALPDGSPRTVTWYRRESERLALEGRYAEAIQADFLALVLALDAQQVLRFHPSKTPAEYLQESRLPPAAAVEFRDLVRRVYGYAFARWPCGPEEYAQWRSQAAPDRYAAAH